MQPGVSVIICTYNGQDKIDSALRYLQLQKVQTGLKWEVIVVDNASTDQTVSTAENIWKLNPVTELKIVNEEKKGLMHARKRGISESKFSFISFIDDDNWVADNWIEKVYSLFETHPDVSACGGRIEAVFEKQKPWWFDQYQNSFAVGEQQKDTGYLKESNNLWGAGLSIRKSVWENIFNSSKAGFKSELEGRKGDKLTAGEDSEINLVIKMTGGRLWYDKDLFLQHFMPEERMQLSVLEKMYFEFGKAEVILRIYRNILDPSIKIRTSWLSEYLFTLAYSYRKYILNLPGMIINAKKRTDWQISLSFLNGYLSELWDLKKNYSVKRTEILNFASSRKK